MTVSIIIAVKIWQKNLEECVNRCLQLDYPDFEIIILPDYPIKEALPSDKRISINIIPTGPVNPARKRDAAVAFAKGEILAFLDDDAYPEKEWLKNAVTNFKDLQVAAVGGPAITPPEDSLEQKASGAVFASILVSGTNFSCRYIPTIKKKVDDFPSCNFFVRKSIMEQLGGFNTDFWPGEDTKLCRDIIKLNKSIIYDPEVLVYHHRRKLFPDHFKQIANYAMHRGYFVKRYPENSLKISYFLPTFFVNFVVFGAIISAFVPAIRILYFSILVLYLSLVLIFSIFNRLGNSAINLNLAQKVLLIIEVFVGIISTHLCYGVYFLKGLFSTKLEEE